MSEANRRTLHGEILLAEGKYAEARSAAEQGLAARRRAVGGEHPLVAASLGTLARATTLGGAPEAALPLAEEAATVAEKTLGPKHPDLATALATLALVLARQKTDHEASATRAVATARRARDVAEAALGAAHPAVAATLATLGAVELAAGNPDAAADAFAKARALHEKTLGADAPQLVGDLAGLGEADLRLGRTASAVDVFTRCSAIAHAPAHAGDVDPHEAERCTTGLARAHTTGDDATP
jgi:serine/threonine-protein kinase